MSLSAKTLLVIFLQSSCLLAWQKTAENDCKNAQKNCTGHSHQCKVLFEQCQSSSYAKDKASFEKELSPYGRTFFMRLSPDKQTRAMDYADESGVAPDDAVAKVSCECKKISK
ncbi:MAG: hypothetical protein JSR58_04955 [Verrucomicrobia bacterium]|nr:hypothetical protein [Verrucomicrobiota bacterium]